MTTRHTTSPAHQAIEGENISWRVAHALPERFFPADEYSQRDNPRLDLQKMGILYAEPAPSWRHDGIGNWLIHILKWVFNITPRDVFIGTVWFLNSQRDPSGRNWIAEITGDELERTKVLLNRLQEQFGIPITVRYEDEAAKVVRLATRNVYEVDSMYN